MQCFAVHIYATEGRSSSALLPMADVDLVRKRKPAEARLEAIERLGMERAMRLHLDFGAPLVPHASAEMLDLLRVDARNAKTALQNYESKIFTERVLAERSKKAVSGITPRPANAGNSTPRLERQVTSPT